MNVSRKGINFMMGFGRFDTSELPRVEYAVNALQRCLPFPLTQAMFDALVSFTHDVGAECLESFRGKDPQFIADEMLRYCYVDRRKDYALERRRVAERELFLSGVDRRQMARPAEARRGYEYEDEYDDDEDDDCDMPEYRGRRRGPEYDDGYQRPEYGRRGPGYDDYESYNRPYQGERMGHCQEEEASSNYYEKPQGGGDPSAMAGALGAMGGAAVGAFKWAHNNGYTEKAANAVMDYFFPDSPAGEKSSGSGGAGAKRSNDSDRGTPVKCSSSNSGVAKKSIHDVALEVIRGNWGNGEERKRRLREAGYDPKAVQEEVNRMTRPKKSIHDVALEAIRGSWGNGEERKRRLREAGYDPKAVQEEVNRIMGAKK